MEFVVENGEGLSNANSFVSVEEADSYVAAFVEEDSGWSSKTKKEKELLLIRATRFLNTLIRWNSNIQNKNQALAFPRKTFYDSEGRAVPEGVVPEIIKQFTAELAVESINNKLTLETEKLLIEKFGDTQDTYAAPVVRGGSEVVRRIVKELTHLGYGSSRTTFVTLYRA